MVDQCDAFTYILQGCFTYTGATYDCPCVSEETRKDIGKIDTDTTSNKT